MLQLPGRQPYPEPYTEDVQTELLPDLQIEALLLNPGESGMWLPYLKMSSEAVTTGALESSGKSTPYITAPVDRVRTRNCISGSTGIHVSVTLNF